MKTSTGYLLRDCYRCQPQAFAFWQKLKGQQRSGKALQWGKRKASGLPSYEGCWYTEIVNFSNQKWNILCDWLRVHLWIILVGPKLEARTIIKEAGCY